MTSSVRVQGRFLPPNAVTYQECGSFLAGPPVGLYDPPSHFGFQSPKHDHTSKVRPDANFLSSTLRFDDRPTLEKRSDLDYRAARDPRSRSRTPGGGYHAPSSTRLLLGHEAFRTRHASPVIKRRGCPEVTIGGADRPLASSNMYASAAMQTNEYVDKAEMGPGKYDSTLGSTFVRAAAQNAYGTSSFSNSARAKAIVPDGEHFVTDVPGLGDTTVSAQGQVYVDPRWNNDMLSSILHRKGRRLVTGEGCMRFLTSAGIPLTSGQPQSGTGGARRGGETHSSHRPRSVMSSRSTPRSARGGATSNTARVMMSPFGTLSDGNSRRPATSSTNRSSPRRRFSPRERGGGGGGRWSCNEWGDPRIETSASADDVAEVAALPRDLGPSLKQA